MNPGYKLLQAVLSMDLVRAAWVLLQISGCFQKLETQLGEGLTQYFKYPEPIRKLIYTTNTVESYHRVVCKVTKSKGAFT